MILPNFPPSDPDDFSATLAPELVAELLEKAQRVDELTQTVELNSDAEIQGMPRTGVGRGVNFSPE